MNLWLFLIPPALLILIRIFCGPKSSIYHKSAWLFFLFCFAHFVGVVVFRVAGYEVPLL